MRYALIALLLAGCAAIGPKVRFIPVDVSPEMRETTEAGIRGVMKDPESARFGTMMASEGPDTYMVCGYVNGRNSFGGYTGEKPFMAFVDRQNRFVGAQIGSDDSSVYAVIQTCKTYDILI